MLPCRGTDSCQHDCFVLYSLTNNTDNFYTDWEESFDSFDQMNLHENLLRGIYAYGGFLLTQRAVVL
jgi:translation initiation factor 4A